MLWRWIRTIEYIDSFLTLLHAVIVLSRFNWYSCQQGTCFGSYHYYYVNLFYVYHTWGLKKQYSKYMHILMCHETTGANCFVYYRWVWTIHKNQLLFLNLCFKICHKWIIYLWCCKISSSISINIKIFPMNQIIKSYTSNAYRNIRVSWVCLAKLS